MCWHSNMGLHGEFSCRYLELRILRSEKQLNSCLTSDEARKHKLTADSYPPRIPVARHSADMAFSAPTCQQKCTNVTSLFWGRGNQFRGGSLAPSTLKRTHVLMGLMESGAHWQEMDSNEVHLLSVVGCPSLRTSP